MKRAAAKDAPVLAVDDIPEGISDCVSDVSAQALELQDADYAFNGSVRVHLQLQRVLEIFTLKGSVQTTASGECCRCLAPVDVLVQAEFQLLFQLKDASPEELEAAAQEDGMVILPPGARELYLGEYVHDVLLLELPLRVYCQQNCRGLCPHCGKDLNQGDCSCAGKQQDPRWEALKRVRFS